MRFLRVIQIVTNLEKRGPRFSGTLAKAGLIGLRPSANVTRQHAQLWPFCARLPSTISMGTAGYPDERSSLYTVAG